MSAARRGSAGPHQTLLTALQRFLQSKGGSAATDAIVSEFRNRVRGEELALFRQLLKSISRFDSSRRVWTLLPEFAS